MNDTTHTPIADLMGESGGLTRYQVKPLRDALVETVEELAELVDAHRANPDGSRLSEMPGLAARRVTVVCEAIDAWRRKARAADAG